MLHLYNLLFCGCSSFCILGSVLVVRCIKYILVQTNWSKPRVPSYTGQLMNRPPLGIDLLYFLAADAFLCSGHSCTTVALAPHWV